MRWGLKFLFAASESYVSASVRIQFNLQTSVMSSHLFWISYQSCLKCGTQVGKLLAAKGWRPHNTPRHPLKGAVLIDHINCDVPPEVHFICS